MLFAIGGVFIAYAVVNGKMVVGCSRYDLLHHHHHVIKKTVPKAFDTVAVVYALLNNKIFLYTKFLHYILEFSFFSSSLNNIVSKT